LYGSAKKAAARVADIAAVAGGPAVEGGLEEDGFIHVDARDGMDIV
jgi:hypothetical protein